MNWKGTHVLVTGGTGFAGSHLVEHLIDAGAVVVTTSQTYDPRSYFYHQQLDTKTILSQTDVTDFPALFHLVTKQAIEYIFHLAAQPLVEVAYANPHQTIETNVMGTVNVLECARLYPNIKGVIVASSDKAYGKLIKKKYLETDPLQGDHPYDVSKSATDLISLAYHRTYALPVVVTRFGNIYGEGDLNFSRIIPGLMQAIINQQPLVLRSDGSFVRDYLHAKDVARGYLTLAEKIDQIKGQAFNFGSHNTHSVLDVIKIAEHSLKQSIPYQIANTAQNEIPYQSLDWSKVATTINWQPQITLEKALPAILKYYQSL